MSSIGPVQAIAIKFDADAKFEGKVLAELEKLERESTIRLLDLLFVGADADTEELLALDFQGEDLGAIVGALLGFEFEGAEAPLSGPNGAVSTADAYGLSVDEIQQLASSIEPGSIAAFMLIEHVWARDLKKAIREAGGTPVGEGFLTPEAMAEVAAEIVAMAEELEALEHELSE